MAMYEYSGDGAVAMDADGGSSSTFYAAEQQQLHAGYAAAPLLPYVPAAMAYYPEQQQPQPPPPQIALRRPKRTIESSSQAPVVSEKSCVCGEVCEMFFDTDTIDFGPGNELVNAKLRTGGPVSAKHTMCLLQLLQSNTDPLRNDLVTALFRHLHALGYE